MTQSKLFRLSLTLLWPLLLLVLWWGQHTAAAQPPANPNLGYGFNVAEWDRARLEEMGFNWMKVFNAPSAAESLHILLRVEANASHMGNLDGFRQSVRDLAQNNGAYIDAYEIGNEVNLDASYGWAAPPIAANYTQLLCIAYEEIKAADPTARVVSAGLAPTGRVTGNWEGHAGHNGLYQDDREYLLEMITAGAGNCLDGVGYHNYGFSAAYDATPDVNGGTAATNCANGFCFRGVEKIYELMQANGLGAKTVWTTEFGWLTDPSEENLASCLSDPGWQGRQWQLVSQQTQAENMVGAYTYAAENWPWMEALIGFNLNFNLADYYDECEQMRFYSVAGRPAEAALRDMPKAYEQIPPELTVAGPNQWTILLAESAPAVTRTVTYTLANTGGEPLTYTVSAEPTAEVMPMLTGTLTAVLSPTETAVFTATLTTISRTLGVYTGTLSIAVEPAQEGFPRHIPLRIVIAEQIYTGYLPLVTRP